MKDIKILFTILMFLFLITSCNHYKTQLLKSTSKNGSLALSVWGERVGSVEPWRVYIVTDYNSQKDTIFTELYADELNTKNIQFNWNSNTDCTIKLTHRDGMVNLVPIKFNVVDKSGRNNQA